MSATAAVSEPKTRVKPPPHELQIYMHTNLLYWWPVWLVGFMMAAWTLIESRHMALVPAGAVVEANTIVLPQGSSPILTPIHMSASRTPGIAFVITVLIVLTFGGGWMRGWRAYTFAACLAAALLLVSWLEGWDDWLGGRRIFMCTSTSAAT